MHRKTSFLHTSRVARWVCEKIGPNVAKAIFAKINTELLLKKRKSSTNIWTIYFYDNFQKNTAQIAQSAKIRQILSPCLQTLLVVGYLPTYVLAIKLNNRRIVPLSRSSIVLETKNMDCPTLNHHFNLISPHCMNCAKTGFWRCYN
jgi:hypothetical protein